MDDEEVLFNFNKEKAVGVLTAANALVSFTVITIITVFIPLVYTVTAKTQEILGMFALLVVLCAPILMLLLLFYVVKYREYKQKCNRILVISMKNKILGNSPGQLLTVGQVAREIEKKTEIPYNEIVVDLVSTGM